MVSYRRLKAGTEVKKGTIVILCQGTGDQRREIEWFTADGTWTVPETENGFWYGADDAPEK